MCIMKEEFIRRGKSPPPPALRCGQPPLQGQG
jgi:hypothetical protein